MPITVRNAADVVPDVRPSIHGGDGSFEMRFVYGNEELVSALRVFELCRLPPGTSIGEHLHDETEEIYFILSGIGTMDLDAPWPGEAAEGQRGRAGSPRVVALPENWLRSRELDESQRAQVAQAELSVSGG